MVHRSILATVAFVAATAGADDEGGLLTVRTGFAHDADGRTASVAATQTSTITTYSAMAFNVLFRGANNDANVAVIAEHAPDILCVREIEGRFAGRFLKDLKADYPHRRYRPHKERPAWGVAIASRYPITQWRVFRERPYTIPAADAVVRVGTRELMVVCVHLIPPVARYRRSEAFWDTIERNKVLRRRQAKYLLYRYQNETRPVLILGDFNEGVGEPALALLKERGFQNSCDIEPDGCQMTWPAMFGPLPARFRFDHILGRNVAFVAGRVIEGGGSDHYPVFARFSLR